jgi:hypothetical protein
VGGGRLDYNLKERFLSFLSTRVTSVGKTGEEKKIEFAILSVRHVTGNDKDYLRKIPRVVW